MTKEEEAGSYNMNDDTNTINNNDYICSDDYNIGEEDDDDNTNLKHKSSQAWGTWEELLLTCAVNRHGLGDWDSVATEVRSRSSVSAVLFSANNCRQKYRDLKRRFQESSGDDTAAAEERGNIPWLEQLRNLRVAELRREVQQYDVSILSLQLKVKKLEEEREGDQKLDLEEERKGERSENDGSESQRREKVVYTAEESDRENRSMNESNSTASGEKTDERVDGDQPSQTRDHSGGNNPDPDPVYKSEAVEEGSEASHSGELRESGTSGRKWKRIRQKHSADSKNNHDDAAGEIRSAASKSQPLIRLLDLIRSHPRGSLFERRLRSQETKEYKSLVKQHLDIETIQRKLKQGSYDSSSLTFYRDLQLLFTNAIVFFPSSSSESMAAHELRTIVYEEMRKETGKSSPRLIKQEASAMTSIKADASETSESSLLSRQQKSSAPLVVCKRKRFVSAKASPSSSSFSQKEETKEETLSAEKENTATGGRSSRRANKEVAAAVIANNTKTGKGKNKQKETESKTNSSNDNTKDISKQERGKTEKKVVSSDKKKSVADFLKRLKKNSPQKEGKDENKSGGNGKKESKSKPRELRSNSVGKKKKAEVENTPVKRAPGRPQKKTVEAVATATATASASGKRGRESGSTGKDNKQPKKRSRR